MTVEQFFTKDNLRQFKYLDEPNDEKYGGTMNKPKKYSNDDFKYDVKCGNIILFNPNVQHDDELCDMFSKQKI
jgi:hypothetical protein